MLNLLGLALASAGDLEAAKEAFQEELEVLTTGGHESVISLAHWNIAEAALRLGETVVAARHQRASLGLGVALGQPVMTAYSLIVAARIAAASGDWRDAVELHVHATVMLAESDHSMYESDQRLGDQLLAEARDQLGDATFALANEVGETMSTPDAVARAEQVLSSVPERSAAAPRPAV